MSKKAFVAVEKSFADETASAFGFLVSEFGLVGPEHQGNVMPVVAFVGTGIRYRIMLDPDDKIVMTRVEVDLDAKRLVAELENLVQASGLDAPNLVAYSARTLNSLRHALEKQAEYVRLLQPFMNSGSVVGLMKAANAREWNIR